MPQVRSKLLRLLAVDEAQLPTADGCSQSLAIGIGTPPPCGPTMALAFDLWPPVSPPLIFQPQGHPKQALIDGEIWPPIFQAEAVRSAKKLQPRDSDVFVCTYPKCGTTWIQHICSQLLYCQEYGPEQGKELCLSSPMIERMGGPFCAQLKQPRLLKTHFSRANCPKSGGHAAGAKYIFAARNPKDCCVSYFHHNRNFKIYDWADGEFDDFFELFLKGKLAFGDYFDHLLGWLPHLEERNVLFLKYEDMLADLEGTVRKIGLFLGGKAAELVANRESLERIVADSRLDAMKQNQKRWFPGSALHKESFIRKGASRDWKNHMSRGQSDRLDALFRRRLAGTVAEGWWSQEMCWDVEDVTESIADVVVDSEPDSGMESAEDESNGSNDGVKVMDVDGHNDDGIEEEVKEKNNWKWVACQE